MLKENIKVFFLSVLIISIFVLFKNGQIFDIGMFFRIWLSPEKTSISLVDDNNLEERYQKLLVENNQLKVLEDENKELRQFLNLETEKEYNLILANILNRDPINRNILIINVGKDDGIEVGQAVVVGNGIIVAKVLDVGIDSSKIRLLTDNFSKLAVKVGQNYNISGILTGSLGLSMDLSYIPQEQEIKKNDLVVTSGIDIKIPPGLVVGQVEEIKFSQEEVFKKASVSPLLDYENINILAIISVL